MSTLAYYVQRREDIQKAITRLLKLGAETENSSGGSDRKSKEAELNDLEALLDKTNRKITQLQSGRPKSFRLKAAW